MCTYYWGIFKSVYPDMNIHLNILLAYICDVKIVDIGYEISYV